MTRMSAALIMTVLATGAVAEPVQPGDVVFGNGAVEASLTGQPGDPETGAMMMDKGAGNCVACHQISELSNLQFQGTVGPPLDGVADRWSEAELRGIVANAKEMFPGTVMPSFYRVSGFTRPGDAFTGKAAQEPLQPLLTAQEVEDVVAFLKTLTDQ